MSSEFDAGLTAEAIQTQQAEQVASNITASLGRDGRNRWLVGAGFLLAGGGAAAAIASGVLHSVEYSQEMPFVPQAQTAVNNIDRVLEDLGEISFPLALAGIGLVKVSARRNPKLARIDTLSSREMTDDGSRNPGVVRKAMALTFAGGLPVVATLGAALGTITSGIGDEVTNGPGRPVLAIEQYAPGNTFVTQSKDALPMVDQYLSTPLTGRITRIAGAQGVRATPVDLNLSSFNYKGENRTDLVFGIDMPTDSAAAWESTDNCNDLPVLVDSAANIPSGEQIEIDGLQAKVVGQTKGLSAINRIGIVADRQAVKACFEKDPNTPDDMVILDTTPEHAQAILSAANTDHEASAVITKQQYLDNSERFWESNVKPITNFLDVVSGGLAFVAMGGIMGSRLLRNRREWAAKFAAGVSNGQMRSTELLRSAKDGVIASVAGTVLATGIMPVFNLLESGLKAGVGFKEVMVGFAVGTVGSVGGAALRLIHPRKTIDPAEHTRV